METADDIAIWLERHARKADQLGRSSESERYAWAALEVRHWAKMNGPNLSASPVPANPLGPTARVDEGTTSPTGFAHTDFLDRVELSLIERNEKHKLLLENADLRARLDDVCERCQERCDHVALAEVSP